MPAYIAKATLPSDLDEFTRGYLECAEWSGLTDEDQEALELAVRPKWDAPSLTRAIEVCADFQASNGVSADTSLGGHDFWLTRNRHGAGFWDGDWQNGAALTANAHAYGEANVTFDPLTETLTLED